MVEILLTLLQSLRDVRLERLVRPCTQPIQYDRPSATQLKPLALRERGLG